MTAATTLQTLIAALLILLGGLLAGKLVNKLLRRLLRELSMDKNIAVLLNKRIFFERLAADTITILIYTATILLFLKKIGILRPTLLALAVVAALLIALSLAFALFVDALPNIFAGLVLAYQRALRPGQRVAAKNLKGTIKKRRLLSTLIETDGDELIVPNKRLLGLKR